MLVRAPRLMLMIMEQNGDLLSDPYRMKPVRPSRRGVLTLRAPSSAAELALMFPKRFLGLWLSIPRANLLRVLVPIAAAGLALAVLTGSLLFSIRAQEYAAVGYLQVKLVLVLVGLLSALMIHRAYGLTLEAQARPGLDFTRSFR